MDSLPGDPLASRLLEGLAALGRLAVFDRRGIGLSDQITDWDRPLPAQWRDDLAAVIDAAGFRRSTIFSWSGPPIARSYAIDFPDRVERLVLWNPGTPLAHDEFDIDALREATMESLEGPSMSAKIFPERWNDPVFRDWHDAAGRAAASPSQAARIHAANFETAGAWANTFDNSAVSVPTLVLTRTPESETFGVPDDFFERAAHLIPGAALVSLANGSFNPFGAGVDDVLAEITRFVTGEVQLPEPERALAAIMFTDVVGSTRRASEVGDRNWKVLLDRHDEISESATHRHSGQLVKSTGDGVLSIFPSVSAAIRASQDITRELARVELAVRVGIHAGHVDRRGDDVSGIALNIAARIMSTADANQILVSDVAARVTDDVTFAPVGEHELKDLDGSWLLYEVR
jgi:class 3 adenylate cyclase/pimeloyl-ACP methyl ester carboxylesterase